jgi:hypothetical protein
MLKCNSSNIFKPEIIFSLFLIASFLFAGCGKSLVVNSETLEGIWLVQQATRDDKPTTTLSNGYFKFDSGNQISTNILGYGEPVDYALSNNNISFENSADAKLKVIELDDSILVLESKIKGKDFHIALMKVDSLFIDN